MSLERRVDVNALTNARRSPFRHPSITVRVDALRGRRPLLSARSLASHTTYNNDTHQPSSAIPYLTPCLRRTYLPNIDLHWAIARSSPPFANGSFIPGYHPSVTRPPYLASRLALARTAMLTSLPLLSTKYAPPLSRIRTTRCCVLTFAFSLALVTCGPMINGCLTIIADGYFYLQGCWQTAVRKTKEKRS